MLIRSVRIFNYKCFADFDRIIFGDKLNLIVGQNNSGKTALFDSLDLQRFSDKPHRDQRSGSNDVFNQISRLDFEIDLSGSELLNILMTSGEKGVGINLNAVNVERAKTILDGLIDLNMITYPLSYDRKNGWRSRNHHVESNFKSDEGAQIHFLSSPDGRSWRLNGPTNGLLSFAVLLGPRFIGSTYVFKAERLNVGQCAISPPTPLLTDASNLAACLQNLQANAHRFRRFVSVVQEVLPSVKWVSAHVVGQVVAGISVWNADPATERDDLRVGLEDCGTGIGQVLAILYAVIESQDKKILVIDEPNSFLHPSASRKLLDILTSYEHQYIISTHSPEMISRSHPDTLHVLRRGDNYTIIEKMGSLEVSSIKDVLNEVGVRLSDVMGLDLIIWVEGQTEEKCFPLLFEAAEIELPRGASIVAVLHTGDFDTKEDRAKLVFRLYERLSHANALVPPALAFVFDREGRSEQELADLERRGSGRVKLLPRMMFENYLIDPKAIAQVLCREANEGIVTEEKINEWLSENGGDAKYYSYEWDKNITDDRWLRSVDAAKLLHDMFNELTDARFIYRKTAHSVALTEWLVEHKPEQLAGLMEFVRGINLT